MEVNDDNILVVNDDNILVVNDDNILVVSDALSVSNLVVVS